MSAQPIFDKIKRFLQVLKNHIEYAFRQRRDGRVWFIVTVLKTVVPSSAPWVRIPLPPPITIMNKDLQDVFKEVPPFLEIFGFVSASISDDKNSFTCVFNPSVDLTHSNGTIVQGGFVSGMLDSAMAQFIIYLSDGNRLPLTLDMTTTFLLPCEPNKQINVVSTIIKNGKSIVFTEAKMYQEDKLIALSSASNKIINLS